MISLFKSGAGTAPPTINAKRVFLRIPGMDDHMDWAHLREQSRTFLTPWEPVWHPSDLTRASFKRRLKRYTQDIREDRGYSFFIFDKDTDSLLGGLSLTNVRRGVTQSCSVGYWMGAPHAGRGYMSEAVQAIIPFVFDGLKLHRVEAACLPENAASIRLLEKAGFEREGYAKQFLCINGRWQDHILFGLIRRTADKSAVANGNQKSDFPNESL